MPEAAQFDELRVRPSEFGENGAITNGATKEVLLRLLASGMSMHQAASTLKRSKHTLNRWYYSEGFREKLKELNVEMFSKLDGELKQMADNTVQRIAAASDEALDKVLELMNDASSEVVQLKAAQDVLDRNPETSKTHKVEKRESVVHIDAKFLALAAEAERETTIDGQ